MVLHNYATWLASQIGATFSSNQKWRKTNRDSLAQVFPALCVSYISLLRVLIGSFYCLCPFGYNAYRLVFVSRHAIENRYFRVVLHARVEPSCRVQRMFFSGGLTLHEIKISKEVLLKLISLKYLRFELSDVSIFTFFFITYVIVNLTLRSPNGVFFGYVLKALTSFTKIKVA